MLNLFYQNKSLNDTLIINVINSAPTSIRTSNDITIGYINASIAFINITNASKKIDTKLLTDGVLFPNNELMSYIKTLVGQDLLPEFSNGFKVGLVEKCEDIQGTHLHKCLVNIGSTKLDIVCGAPNVKEGLRVVVATNGTMLPSGKQIIAGQLLGHKSEGMICSYRELAINKESNGIIELNSSFNIGDYFAEAYTNLRN